MGKAELVAQACRVLSRAGQDHFCYGHVSARVDDRTVAIKAAGVPMATVRPEDVALVTLEGEPVTSQHRLHDETVMHLAVYRSRPEVSSVTHTHPIASHAASLRGEPSGVYSQDQVAFHDSLSFYDSALLVNDAQRAAALTGCLAENRAVLMRAHGILTVGGSVEESVVLAVLLDRAMQVILAAGAGAGAGDAPAPIPSEEVAQMSAAFERAHLGRVRDVWAALTAHLPAEG